MSFSDLIASLADQDYYRKKFDWFDPRLQGTPWGAIGNALGVAGTGRDIASEGILQPLLGAMGAGLNRMPGGGRKLFSDQPEAPLRGMTREDLAAYFRENTGEGAHWLGQLLGGMVADPLTYVGGPISGAARLGERLPLVGKALGVVADVDQGVSQALGKGTEAAIGLAGEGAKRIPVVGKLFEKSAGSHLATFTDSIQNAFQSIINQDHRASERMWRTVFGKGRTMAGKTAKQLDAIVGGGWDRLEQQIGDIQNPAQQAAAIELFGRGRLEADRVSADIARRSKDLELDPLWATDPQLKIDRGELWHSRVARVADIQEAIKSGLTAFEDPAMDWASKTFDPAVTGFLQTRVRDTLERMKEYRVKAKEAVEAFGKDDPTTGLPWDVNKLRDLEDVEFRAGQSKAEAELSAFLSGDARALDPFITPDEMRAGYDRGVAEFSKAYGDLYGAAGLPEWMGRIDPDLAGVLREHEAPINRAVAAINGDRNRVLREALPAVEDHFNKQVAKGALTAAEADPRKHLALTSSRELLGVLRDAGRRDVQERVVKTISRYGRAGDILNDETTLALVTQRVTQAQADAMGIKQRLPEWYVGAVSSWKEMALMAPSYHISNLAGGLFLSEKAGVPWTAVMKRLFHNWGQAGAAGKEALLYGNVAPHRVDVSTVPLLEAYGRSRDGVASLPAGITNTLSNEFTAMGQQQAALPTTTALKRYAPQVGTVLGLGMAGSEYMQHPDDPQAALVKGAGVGLGSALALPRGAALSRALGRTIEDALRTTAFYQRVEALHDDITRKMAAHIDGFTPSPTPTSLTSGVMAPTPDLAGLKGWFEGAGGEVSPQRLMDVAANRFDLHADDAARLGGQWDQLINSSERSGVDLSNRINFDYRDVPNITEWARTSGVMPFVTWQTKALPRFAAILMQNPRFIVLIDEYNQASNREIEGRGLPQRYEGRVPLGDQIVEGLFGRPGELLGNPLMALLPVMQQVNAPEAVEGMVGSPLDKAVRLAGEVGAGISPFAQLPLQAVGLLAEPQGNQLRTSGYIEALTGTNPETPLREGIRRTRKALGQEASDPLTDTASRDYLVNQRIVEIYHEDGHTGKPTGAYQKAIDNPNSAIWQRALADVKRAQAGQTALSAAVPIKGKYLSKSEAELRESARRQGVSPGDLSDLREAPPTPEELLAATRSLMQRGQPSSDPAMLTTVALAMRRDRQLKGAEQRDPDAVALRAIAGSRESRAWEQWRAFSERVKRLRPASRQVATQKFLADNPSVAAVVNSYRRQQMMA